MDGLDCVSSDPTASSCSPSGVKSTTRRPNKSKFVLNLGVRGRILATKLILSPGIQRLKIFFSNRPVNLLHLTEAVFKARSLIVRGVMTFVGLSIDPTIQRVEASESFPVCGSLRRFCRTLVDFDGLLSRSIAMAAILVAVCDLFRCAVFREVHYGIHWRRWQQEQQSEFCEFLNGLLSMLLSLLHNKSFSFWRKKATFFKTFSNRESNTSFFHMEMRSSRRGHGNDISIFKEA
jgi:hypothetical protein